MTEEEFIKESAAELGVDEDKLKALLEKWRRIIGRQP